MEKKYTIGIDFGTLSGRAVLVDAANGHVAAAAVHAYTHGVMDTTLPDGTALPDSWALQHPADYLEVLEETLPQLLRSAGGVTIIDDAFNSNPRGAKAALDVLSKFPGRRIIVTPGMVELGEDEDKYNREFGREMASAADVCVLIGKKHTLPIQEGLIEAGYPQQDIHVFPSLNDATQWLNGFMRPGDFILYENDLPDHYSE